MLTDTTMTSRATGFTMLEVLIAIVILAFGLLGVAGLQAYAVANNQSAALRVAAAGLATDMVDRMKLNTPVFLENLGYYNKPNSVDYTTAVASCTATAGCSVQERAQNDLYEWAQRVAASLPNGKGIVCVDSTPNDGASQAAPACDNTGINLYVVKIWWRDDRMNVATTRPQFVWAFNP
jgi:type IV pilus assembly protein PilV